MKKLPLGITTFKDIRDKSKDYLYVDKTEIASNLIENGKYYFLSRPRRFGKSLFLDTLSDIFQAKKEQFEGLYIYTKRDWSQSNPVIKIDFNDGNFKDEEGVKDRIFTILETNQERLQISCKKQDSISSCFAELIQRAYEKDNKKVVILIDEYDKPILDNITDKELSSQARDILRYFYAVIKGADQYLEFVFMTGVSKFSKMHLFSGLNNLQDITIMNKYATICGYTDDDIKETFAEHLVDVNLDKLKRWYNGYNYFGDCVYNPYDILLFISNSGEFKNYWWSTGNPKFLIDVLKTSNYNIPQLENIVVNDEVLNTFDIEYIDLVALLWQTGYLTFDKKILNFDDTYKYKLKIPNKEIQQSLNVLFLKYLTNQSVEIIQHQNNIYTDISENLEHLKTSLISLFASIPYHYYVKDNLQNYEGHYASVIYAYFVSLGFPCTAEDVTNKGRIDLTIKLPNRIIIIEFKVDVKEKALKQIKERKYYEKYLNEEKELFIVGLCFSSDTKNITEFEWEQIGSIK